MPATIRLFYNVTSPWAYLGIRPLAALARRTGARVEPHPIPLIEENGGIYSRNRPEARRRYWQTDLKRWAARHGLPLVLDGRAALKDPAPAQRLVVAAYLDGGDWIALSTLLQSAFWAEGADIGDAGVRAALLARSGLTGVPTEDRAAAQDVSDHIAAARDLAARLGVFGIPTHEFEGELYWGQDSLPLLEQHLDRALRPGLPGPLVSTEWLAQHLGRPGLVVLDATQTLPGVSPAAPELHRAAHIPGARFFDIDAVADPDSGLPHMLPDAAGFARHAAALGIGHDTAVVIYDAPGLQSAPRVWWTLRAFGLRNLAILDGGLRAWVAEGRPLERGVTPYLPPGIILPRVTGPDPSVVADLAQVHDHLHTGAAQIVDARAAGRFAGTQPEPRPGLRLGHIPGSLNLPFDRLSDPASGRVLPPEVLRARLAEAGIDPARPIVATCGSGVTAGAIAFALHLIGAPDAAVYDGSWTEWGGRSDTEVETGSASAGVPA